MTNIQEQAEKKYNEEIQKIIPLMGDPKLIETVPLKSDLGKHFSKNMFIAGASMQRNGAGVWVKCIDRMPVATDNDVRILFIDRKRFKSEWILIYKSKRRMSKEELVEFEDCEWYDENAVVQGNDWISVEEKLPELVNFGRHSSRVLTISESGHFEIGYLNENNWRDDTGDLFSKRGYTITHWMPLPTPPQSTIKG